MHKYVDLQQKKNKKEMVNFSQSIHFIVCKLLTSIQWLNNWLVFFSQKLYDNKYSMSHALYGTDNSTLLYAVNFFIVISTPRSIHTKCIYNND